MTFRGRRTQTGRNGRPDLYAAAEDEWPREIRTGDALVVLYQPQIDSIEGNDIHARAAVSVKPGGQDAKARQRGSQRSSSYGSSGGGSRGGSRGGGGRRR